MSSETKQPCQDCGEMTTNWVIETCNKGYNHKEPMCIGCEPI